MTEHLTEILTDDYDTLMQLAEQAREAGTTVDWSEQLGFYLSDVPDATPAQIREAVQEFLDRDPRETP